VNAQSRLTEMQLAGRRYGRPDIAAMSNEQRTAAGLMTRRQAAEHEHLASLPQAFLAERVRGPVPDDIWADAAAWQAWQAAGHMDQGCEGWFRDSPDGRVVCSCGEVVPLPVEATALWASIRSSPIRPP
jgi:hypothetical protein